MQADKISGASPGDDHTVRARSFDIRVLNLLLSKAYAQLYS